MPTDRLRTELEKLRALQPDLTREQALTFFTKFHPNAEDVDVISCIDQMEFRTASTPRPPKANKSTRGNPPKSKPSQTTAKALSPRTPPARKQPSQTATCPRCGKSVGVSPKGKLKTHRAGGGRHACVGGGKTVAKWAEEQTARQAQKRDVSAREAEFMDNTGVAKGVLAPSDLEWVEGEGWLIPIGRAKPSDIVTARRVLLAATNGHVQSRTARLVQRWYQDMKRRPDLFDPRKKPRAWPDSAVGDPEKGLRKPTTPGKKVFYREVLVGKRN